MSGMDRARRSLWNPLRAYGKLDTPQTYITTPSYFPEPLLGHRIPTIKTSQHGIWEVSWGVISETSITWETCAFCKIPLRRRVQWGDWVGNNFFNIILVHFLELKVCYHCTKSRHINVKACHKHRWNIRFTHRCSTSHRKFLSERPRDWRTFRVTARKTVWILLLNRCPIVNSHSYFEISKS